MEYILVLLIVALLNGAIAYIDGLMEGIVPLTLYAEQYMSTLAGVDLFEALFDIVFGFGVSLIILKFLKKGFETYVLWSDGDADEEPIALLTNFFKAMAVAVCFPTMYGWLAGIVEEMSDKMLEQILSISPFGNYPDFSRQAGRGTDDEYAHLLGRGLHDFGRADAEVPSGVHRYDRRRRWRSHRQQRIPFCAPGADGQGHGKVRWRRMVTMDDLSKAIILLVRVGAVARFIYCMVRLAAAEEQAAQYKKRARNTVIFYVIAESIWQIKDLILYYYS